MPRDHEIVRPPRAAATPRSPLATDAAVLSLDGRWRFRWGPDATHDADPADAGTAWGDIEVPGHWQLQGFGSPAYTNIVYPFPVEPPFVPHANPTGEYRRDLELPATWPRDGRTVLRFDGVDSWYEVWVNGIPIGDASGSRLANEFDVTAALRPGVNQLAVRVRQWSFASYLEDQDQWWLSGIFRSVSLRHRPDGGIDDVFVHADWDHDRGIGILSVDVDSTAPVDIELAALGVTAAPGTTVEVPGARPWSAESPVLYDLVVSTEAETARLRVGFRSVTIDDGVLMLNGRPLVFRGVNRHDFDPRRGRAVTREAMEADVRLMKQHHINAVRTSHYPPDSYFLELCDTYGLYVVDECDLETHGFSRVGWRANPPGDPAWTEVLLDRIRRTVERDKNHTSVVMWSLGNEAGWGPGLQAMADWARERDPARPIHYEQDEQAVAVDIFSRMYPRVRELEAFGRREEPALDDPELDAARRAMPMVMCEYAHAMGNGPGGLAEYEAIVDRYPRLAGGFIWEWFDHGIALDLEDGVSYRYGGDFGEVIHDGSFVIDGLLLPDRTPSPGLTELAAVFSPVRLRADEHSLTLENRWAFRDTSGVRLEWVVDRDGQPVASDGMACPLLQPGERTALAIAHGVEPSGDGEWWLTVRAVTSEDASWAPAGHELGRGQTRLDEDTTGRPRSEAPADAPVVQSDGGITLGGVELDRRGILRRLFGHDGREAGVSVWRAPTEHAREAGEDFGYGDEPMARAAAWLREGLDRLERRLIALETTADGVVVRSRLAAAGKDAGFLVTETWSAGGGRIRLSVEVERQGDLDHPVPRLDVVVAIACPDPRSVPVTWFGLGPGENYPDSREAAWVGRHHSTVGAMQTDYVVPQENGCRMETRWAELGLDRPLHVIADTPATFTVRPWSTAALAAARHADELREEPTLWMHWGAGIDGLGSAACGAAPSLDATFRFHTARIDLEFRS